MTHRTLPRALDWLTEVGRELAPDTRDILLGGVIAPRHILLAMIAALVTSGTALARTGSPIFLAITACHVVLGLSILAELHLRRTGHRDEEATFLLFTSLVSTGLVGVSLALCFSTGDPVLQVLGPVNMMGFVTAAVARNSTMPRLVICQVMLLLVPFMVALGLTGNPWWAILALECPLFLLAIHASIRRISDAYVAVLLAERESQERALRDPLTGLSNRQGLMNALAHQVGDGEAEEAEETSLALLFIDLDGFKEVNDRHGHAAGDEVLRNVAERIGSCMPAHGLAARLGGDEFVIVLPGGDLGEATRLSQRLILAIALPVVLPDAKVVFLGASVGIASAHDGETPAEILGRADAALYRAKAEGRGRYVMAGGERLAA